MQIFVKEKCTCDIIRVIELDEEDLSPELLELIIEKNNEGCIEDLEDLVDSIDDEEVCNIESHNYTVICDRNGKVIAEG